MDQVPAKNFMRDKDEYAIQILTDSKYAISAGSILKVQNFLKILIINFQANNLL